MKQVGRYEIVEELGRGAMGVVYKALDPAIGRTVAIKAIRLSELVNSEERQRVRDRLLREAQAAGVLSHPNIVTIYDVREEEDFAYIFMEYVHGPSLEQMLRKRSLPQSAELLHFLRQIAEALDYAHRKGIVHRDIKPANIIIFEGAPGVERLAKIADFGVAKFVSHEMTHSGTMIGTPNYMSPEQIQGLTIDGRSDQFSLAVVVYEILCGEKPFAGDTLPTLFYLICKQEPKAIEQANATLSETVGKVLSRALEKDPNQRFASCGDFIGALTIALGDCPAWTPTPRVASIVERSMLDATSADTSIQRAPEAVKALPRDQIPESVPKPNDALPAREQKTRELPSANRRRRGEGFVEAVDSQSARPLGKKLGVILAFLFLIAAAIVFIVRWNSGPSVPVQVLDSNAGPVASPPPDEAKVATKKSGANTEPARPKQTSRPAGNSPSSFAQVQKQSPPKPSPGNASIPLNNATAEGGVADIELLSEPPGAKIVVDNKSDLVCQSPCTLSLSNGRHTMTATLGGYNVARRIFTVPNDNSIFISLSQSVGVLVVTSFPSGSTIFVDGKDSGRTPSTLHLSAGVHRLAWVYGSRQHEETVDVPSDGFEVRSFRWQ